MRYAFDDADADERHTTQYFEMFCNRGIYHQGWTAVTRHSTPWVFGRELPAFDDDVWELYDTNADWTQAHDLAAEHPDKLAELQRLFLIEATKYNVLPLDDRRVERFNSDLAGRPTLIKGNTQLLFGGMGRSRRTRCSTSRTSPTPSPPRSWCPTAGADGVIIAQGGAFAGWALYPIDGQLKYCHNLFGLQQFTSRPARSRSRPGPTRCAWSSPTTAVAWPRAATSPSSSTGPGRRGPGRRHRADALLGRRDLRRRARTPAPRSATTTRPRPAASTASSGCNSTSTRPPTTDHLISPEERLRVAMARQ